MLSEIRQKKASIACYHFSPVWNMTENKSNLQKVEKWMPGAMGWGEVRTTK